MNPCTQLSSSRGFQFEQTATETYISPFSGSWVLAVHIKKVLNFVAVSLMDVCETSGSQVLLTHVEDRHALPPYAKTNCGQTLGFNAALSRKKRYDGLVGFF